MARRSDHKFSEIPQATIPRSVFDRSHGYKTTFNSGFLIPFFWDEVLPGDTFKLSVSVFARLSTVIVPIMDNLYLETFFFYVPYRLLWTNWEHFNGQRDNPDNTFTTTYLTPIIASGSSVVSGSVGDYLGLPGNTSLNYQTGKGVSAFPFRAYNFIFNEWFRDQNLQAQAAFLVNDGPDPISSYPLFRRGKRHDYFTSALPWPQKGPGVSIGVSGYASLVQWPIGSTQRAQLTADVYAQTTATVVSPAYVTQWWPEGQSETWYPAAISYDSTTGVARYPQGSSYVRGSDIASGLKADLGTATMATINSLRQAFQIQKMQERDARGGTRYTEILRSHFGVVSPDSRLQRPEYLGGGSSRIHIHPVAQTSVTSGTSPLANLAAYGVCGDKGHGFNKSFVEHGLVLGLVNVRADLTYQQGIHRKWWRRTREDFYWPALAHLGEQAIYNKEIYFQGTAADEAVFGYQERWAEYRYFPSLVTGLFKSGLTGTLDYWHLAQNFSSLPALNDSFIQDIPPVQRIMAVKSPQPEVLFDSWISLKCTRPMPVYSVPGYIDHF